MEDTKSLQKGSKYNEYDEDGDGIVTDEELRHVKEIKEVEHNLRKQRAQRRMATWTITQVSQDLESEKGLRTSSKTSVYEHAQTDVQQQKQTIST